MGLLILFKKIGFKKIIFPLAAILLGVYVAFYLYIGLINKRSFDCAKLGNELYLKKKYSEAATIYEKNIESGCKTFDLFYNLGDIYYFEQKNYKKAEEIYKKGLSIYPTVGILHETLSQLYFDMNNFQGAVEEYRMAVESTRDRAVTIYARKAKELLKNQGKSDKEIYDFFLGIIKFNPKDTNAIYQAAEYDQKEGRFQDALDKFKRIVKLEPRMEKHLALEIGVCYFYMKDYRTALEYFRKAQKAGDIVPEIFINKAKENVTAQ